MCLDLDEINKCLINLPERVDRLERSMDEISTFFTNQHVNFIPGVRDSPTFKGIAQAHINCIKLAKENNWPHVLIIEDDVNFQSTRSREYADRAFNDLPDDWDILLSSVYLSKGLNKVKTHWNQTKEFCGLTFYAVKSSAYDKIIEFDKSNHIDRAMIGLGLNCFVAYEFFAIQYPGLSDQTGKIENYDNLLDKFKVLH